LPNQHGLQLKSIELSEKIPSALDAFFILDPLEMRALGIADAITAAFLRVLAKEIHVGKAGVRRPAFISFTVNPVVGRVFAVEAASGHLDFLSKAQTKQTATTIAKNGKL
jgi:hypothetical protein